LPRNWCPPWVRNSFSPEQGRHDEHDNDRLSAILPTIDLMRASSKGSGQDGGRDGRKPKNIWSR
jgi:hypothetical protein